ncbi:hypothetical protein E2C01_051559 [Portunus trituberculatus]|uniref:Uncharacterized protein n=1 Tax=Portunus trituberculatus TaxID=210409 RepID=A0A5B7GJ20_PORTR|nr:hypothetical protein [Portunus trituberculatus]
MKKIIITRKEVLQHQAYHYTVRLEYKSHANPGTGQVAAVRAALVRRRRGEEARQRQVCVAEAAPQLISSAVWLLSNASVLFYSLLSFIDLAFTLHEKNVPLDN